MKIAKKWSKLMRQIFGVFEKSKNTLGIFLVFYGFLMKFNGFSIKWTKLSISGTNGTN